MTIWSFHEALLRYLLGLLNLFGDLCWLSMSWDSHELLVLKKYSNFSSMPHFAPQNVGCFSGILPFRPMLPFAEGPLCISSCKKYCLKSFGTSFQSKSENLIISWCSIISSGIYSTSVERAVGDGTCYIATHTSAGMQSPAWTGRCAVTFPWPRPTENPNPIGPNYGINQDGRTTGSYYTITPQCSLRATTLEYRSRQKSPDGRQHFRKAKASSRLSFGIS